MARPVYSEINLHITWHTEGNVPVLVDSVGMQLHRFLRDRAHVTEGVIVHAIDGMPAHVHMAVTVPPALNMAEWIGQLKGASARFINHEICNKKVLSWQTGYGVVSFGTRDLPWVVAFVRNQKDHHAKSQVHDRLERVERIVDDAAARCGGRSKPVETG